MSIQIEEGRFYKTRDGRKVGPMIDGRIKSYSGEWAFTVEHAFESSLGKAWRDNGTFDSRSGYHQHQADIVALWEDGPVRTRTVTEIVEGVYGRLFVSPKAPDHLPRNIAINLTDGTGRWHGLPHYWDLAELSDAIDTLTLVRDAMLEMQK